MSPLKKRRGEIGLTAVLGITLVIVVFGFIVVPTAQDYFESVAVVKHNEWSQMGNDMFADDEPQMTASSQAQSQTLTVPDVTVPTTTAVTTTVAP